MWLLFLTLKFVHFSSNKQNDPAYSVICHVKTVNPTMNYKFGVAFLFDTGLFSTRITYDTILSCNLLLQWFALPRHIQTQQLFAPRTKVLIKRIT